MAVEGIDIDIKYVADLAVNIEKISATVDEELNAINSEMKNVENVWKSSAQKSLNTKFQSINEKREKFCHDLDAYAQYLKNVAAEYGYTEQKINKNAESFD